MLILLADLVNIIMEFSKNKQQQSIVEKIPYQCAKWFWRRGYIKSPHTGELHSMVACRPSILTTL